MAGYSAGGQLAAMLLTDSPLVAFALDATEHRVKRAIPVSGLHDLEVIRAVPFVQADLALTPETVASLTPVRFSAPVDATIHAVVSGDESTECRRQTKLLQSHWGRSAVPVCEEITGHRHFGVLDDPADFAGGLHALTHRPMFDQ